MYTFNIFSPCTIRHLQRRLKKSNSAAIRIHVHTDSPALSYVKTPITSTTVRAQWDITADFVKNKVATSCKEHLQKNGGSNFGVYQLSDPTTISMYEVFCDAISEEGFVWTLIESFSRRNKDEFEDKAFFKDYPKNQEAFKLDKFRLSLPRIDSHSKPLNARASNVQL